jgi:aspartate racemase
MIGGLGPESTVDYYQRIIKSYREQTNDNHYPCTLINSIDMTAMLKMIADKDWNNLVNMLTNAIHALSKAGADFAFISSNTPHIVFEQVQKASPIPLISIVEATRRYAQSRSLKKIGLLGTLFTMENSFYQTEFDKSNISLVVPTKQEQMLIHQKLMTEIELGIFLDSTRKELLEIVKRMITEDSIEGVILGCTELPLILTKDEFGIPFLNTTEIHVESILEECLRDV